MDPHKASPAAGIALTALAAALIAGLLTFAAPCAHGAGGEVLACAWAQRAMLGMGAVLAVISLVRIFEQDEGERRGLSFSAALVGALIAATPGWIIGLCPDAAMSCNAVMAPFARCAGMVVAAVGGVDLTRRLLSLRKR